MAVRPREAQGVVSDLLDLSEIEIAAGDEADRTRVALARSAWAKSPKNFMWIRAVFPIRPGDGELAGAVRCLHVDGPKSLHDGHCPTFLLRRAHCQARRAMSESRSSWQTPVIPFSVSRSRSKSVTRASSAP